MAEILRDDKLTADDKQCLYDLARTRFWHRRVMAYIALTGIIVFSGINVFRPEADVAWINTTLAAVVVAYYGASAARPGS